MKINENTIITGTKCVLVPYRKEHVEKYHEWMQDPYLQQTTESEPLTMEQEYIMQKSWRDDEDKCTFILLDTTAEGANTEQQPVHRNLQLMAGDVNLYFNDPEDRSTAEIEVMVAEERSRRKGIAREALNLMMAFAVNKLGITRFRAKILEDNLPSIALFQSLGYLETRHVQVFHEVHMELDVSPGTTANTSISQIQLQYGEYDD